MWLGNLRYVTFFSLHWIANFILFFSIIIL